MLVFDPRDYGANPDDNIDDTFAIQAALDAARDAGGGHVLLSAGTYIITGGDKASDGALRIHSNTEISGAGMGETVLKLQDGWETKITGLIRTPVNESTENVIIRDLTLDGNRDNTTADVDGIMTGVLPGDTERHDNNILIERVEIHDVSRIAFNPHEQTHNLTIRDSVAHHNSWDGFVADYVVNGVYEGNVAYANDRHGFNVVTHTNNFVLKDNVSYDNGENGIVLQRGSGSTTIEGWEDMLNHDILVIGNLVHDNGKNGILLKQVQDNQVIGNTIYGNGDDGIQLEGAFGNTISGNTIDSNTHGIEIRNYGGSIPGPDTSYDNIVTDNVITASQAALKESHSTTVNNVFAGNTIEGGDVEVGETALVLVTSDGYTYQLLEIPVSLPTNATGSGEPPVTEPQPTSPPVVTEPPVVEPPVVEPVEPPPAPPVVEENLFLSGTSSSDMLEGGNGNDKLKGRSGDDILYGGAGDDYLEGNGGDDVLYGGLGADLIKGSGGTDTFAWNSLDEGGDRIKDFRSHEKLDLTGLADEFVNFNSATAFQDGFLRLEQNGKDVDLFVNLEGSNGSTSDVLLVKLLKTDLDDDISIDNFILPEISTPPPMPAPEPVIPEPEPVVPEPEPVLPAPEVVLEVPTFTPNTSIESLELIGGNGKDTLVGGEADDVLKGRRDDDVLVGGGGKDDLWGNGGNDILYGGAGADRMKGGDGDDTFVLDALSGDVDTIRDFRSNDQINVYNVLEFDGLSESIADFIKVTEHDGDTILSVDVDGAANGQNFTEVAILSNVDDLGSAQDLYNSGHLLLSNTEFA